MVSKFIPLKQRVIRAGIHIPVGVAIFEFCYQGYPVAGIITTFLFWRYEANEDRWLEDHAFYDIFGALIGLIGWGGIRILLGVFR